MTTKRRNLLRQGFLLASLAILVPVFAAASNQPQAADKPKTAAPAKAGKWTGMVSDQQCGANVNEDCAKRCLDQGIPPVLVVDKTGDLLDIANAGTVKMYPGKHVDVTGTLAGTTLTVKTVKPVVEKPAAAKTK